MGKDVFEDSKKRNNEGNNMSRRVIMAKWKREIMKNHKPRTAKQILKEKIRTDKIKKEVMVSDFHEITWDKIY